ncbi:MAG: CRISPR-associated endonuclease Cas2 [Anaerostipes sp.]|nr:CRISPR-associated endonuclease Cas2 [Anaerostipes sp.]
MEDYFFEEKIGSTELKYLVLVIYDIVDNKHRLKFSKELEKYGFRIQKSAFEARLTKKQYKKLLRVISQYAIDDANIRVYKLKGYGEVKSWGGKKEIYENDVIII